MRKIAILIIFIFAAAGLPAGDDHLNCFTVVVGKDASADGSVLLAHNKDDSGRLLVNVYKVTAQEHGKSDSVVFQNGITIPQVKNTAAMLWLEIPESEFADSFVNEYGVAVASDSCPSREDKPELVRGGIGYMLRRLIAERAHTAREGVRLAGELVSQFGYSSSGRTYIIADAREGWLLHIVMGKHWVAQRVADDEAAVIANCYTIGAVDLGDPINFMAAPDLIEYAVQRGWYDPEKDGDFDFARAYSHPANLADMRNTTLRQWRGISLLSAKSHELEERLPFSFKPKRAIRLNDLFRVLRDHYEGTEYDLSNHYKNGSPNSGRNRTICTESTQYAFVAQLRDGLPAEIAHAVWLCLRRPDSNAFSPWYVAADRYPDGYGLGNAADAWKTHFSPLPAQALDDSGLAFNTYARLSEMVDKQYRVRIEKTQKLWRNHEDRLFRDVKDHEEEFVYLLKTSKAVAQKIIVNYFHNLEYRRWFLALELLREFR